MRAITLSAYLLAAGLFAATFAGSSASADWSANYAWCLMTESSQECAFTSMAQCLASKHGNVDFCEPNNTYIGNTRSFWFPKIFFAPEVKIVFQLSPTF